MVDTYGIPTYQEGNPAIIATVTFPFLFGMMFSDMGHGSLLIIIALLIIFNAEKLRKNPAMKLVLDYRYLLLLEGIFAVYCGAIYSEFFSVPLDLFTSCYDLSKRVQWEGRSFGLTRDDADWAYVQKGPGCTYALGSDPVHGLTAFAGNGLNFSNTLKMKTSVIFAILH